MYQLREVRAMAERLMRQEFIIEGQPMSGDALGYRFEFDNARKRLGCCKHWTKRISLSNYLCLGNLDKVDGKLMDTMLHELAHAFARKVYGGNCGHDYRWVNIAKSIGCNGERCYDHSEVTAVTRSKYTHTCPTCLTTKPVHRRVTRSCSCGACSGGRYNPQHKLILTQNY